MTKYSFLGRRSRRSFLSSTAAVGATLALPGCDKKDGGGGSEAPPGRSTATFWFSYGGRNREVLEKIGRAHV